MFKHLNGSICVLFTYNEKQKINKLNDLLIDQKFHVENLQTYQITKLNYVARVDCLHFYYRNMEFYFLGCRNLLQNSNNWSTDIIYSFYKLDLLDSLSYYLFQWYTLEILKTYIIKCNTFSNGNTIRWKVDKTENH